MKQFATLIILIMLLAACGGGDDVEGKLIGNWSGTATSAEGESMMMDAEFVEDGNIVMVAAPGTLDVIQTGTWSIDGDNVCIDTGDGAGDCAAIEFIGDDTVRITGNSNGTVFELRRDE